MTNVETSSHHPPVAASVKRTHKKTSECETTLVKQYSATVFCSTDVTGVRQSDTIQLMFKPSKPHHNNQILKVIETLFCR